MGRGGCNPEYENYGTLVQSTEENWCEEPAKASLFPSKPGLSRNEKSFGIVLFNCTYSLQNICKLVSQSSKNLYFTHYKIFQVKTSVYRCLVDCFVAGPTSEWLWNEQEIRVLQTQRKLLRNRLINGQCFEKVVHRVRPEKWVKRRVRGRLFIVTIHFWHSLAFRIRLGNLLIILYYPFVLGLIRDWYFLKQF